MTQYYVMCGECGGTGTIKIRDTVSSFLLEAPCPNCTHGFIPAPPLPENVREAIEWARVWGGLLATEIKGEAAAKFNLLADAAERSMVVESRDAEIAELVEAVVFKERGE